MLNNEKWELRIRIRINSKQNLENELLVKFHELSQDFLKNIRIQPSASQFHPMNSIDIMLTMFS